MPGLNEALAEANAELDEQETVFKFWVSKLLFGDGGVMCAEHCVGARLSVDAMQQAQADVVDYSKATKLVRCTHCAC